MGVSLVNSNNHFRRLSILALFILLLFIAFASAITPTLFLGGGGGERKERSGSSSSEGLERVLAQKRRVVPGSTPPTCLSKCENCSPCLPVHVAIQPGMSIPMEYYPEAWRCKCSNMLFMP